jgi:hypothetical protein
MQNLSLSDLEQAAAQFRSAPGDEGPRKNIYMGATVYDTLVESFRNYILPSETPFTACFGIPLFTDSVVPANSYLVCTAKEFETYKSLKLSPYTKDLAEDAILKMATVLSENQQDELVFPSYSAMNRAGWQASTMN